MTPEMGQLPWVLRLPGGRAGGRAISQLLCGCRALDWDPGDPARAGRCRAQPGGLGAAGAALLSELARALWQRPRDPLGYPEMELAPAFHATSRASHCMAATRPGPGAQQGQEEDSCAPASCSSGLVVVPCRGRGTLSTGQSCLARGSLSRAWSLGRQMRQEPGLEEEGQLPAACGLCPDGCQASGLLKTCWLLPPSSAVLSSGPRTELAGMRQPLSSGHV